MLVAGRYELRDVLGRGSVGTVYSGRDVVLDRPVALKLFPPELADPQDVARYEQEARVLARLNHPSLVTVFDAGVDSSAADAPKPFLVMQLVEGPTLLDRLRDGPLPAADVELLTRRLASALAHIHAQGVVHRDIKPANIILDAAGATLTDFGIARLIDGTRMTATGFTLGTANYLSPEQVSGGDVRAPSDVYSLGLVLLECLTGDVEYPGVGFEAALPRLHRPPAIPDWLPQGWMSLLSAMTDTDPDARPSASEVAARAARIDAMPASGIDATRILPTAQAARTTRRRAVPPWMIGALIAGVLLAILIAVVASAGSGSSLTGPAYPTAGGQLGTDLRQLELEVADDGVTLQGDVLALSRAAAGQYWAAAERTIRQSRADLAAASTTGEVTTQQANAIGASLTAVQRDIVAARPSAPTRPAASHSSKQPAPPPPPHGKPGKGKGKGHGEED
ncbi:MAG TPA: serine/threonine-protein kinase [Jatrophihabitans sp.]|nr:serine/threonine-protein kinase [Jatrophihabitans sp.]